MKKAAKRQQEAQPRPQTQPPAAGSSAKYWALAALVLVVAGGTWAVFEFVVWNTLPSELVGTWVVDGGEQDGATFEFYRSGKLVGHVNNRGNLDILYATVRVEGKQLYSTTHHPKTGQELTTTQTIITLTPNYLVVEDQKGNRMNMKRAN